MKKKLVVLVGSTVLSLAILPSAAQNHVGSNLKVLHDSLPKYPKEARKQKVEGIVRLRLTLGRGGNVANAEVLSGDPTLAASAQTAAMKRRYDIGTQTGESMEPQIETAFCFLLTHPGPLVFEIDDPEMQAEFSAVINSHSGSRKGSEPPRAVYTPDPPYTDAARRDKLQGVSVVELLIDEKGQPRYAIPVKKLGDGLDENAITTVRQWKFQPATKDSKPVPCLATVEVAFHLY